MNVIVFLGWTLLGLFIIELLLQLLHRMNFDSPLPYGLRRNDVGRLGYISLTPDFKGTGNTGILYSTNALGYRDDEIEPGRSHILFLGDSTTFGLNIEHRDTYPEVVEGMLNRVDDRYQSVNTASPGQGTFEELDILKSVLKRRALNLKAVVLGFYCNDFSDNFTYDAYKNMEDKGGAVFKLKRFIKSRIGIPRTYVYLDFMRYRLIKRFYDTDKAASGRGNEYAIRPGSEIALDLLEEKAIYENRSWKLTIEALGRISQLCRQNKLLFIFVYLPSEAREILSNKSPRYKCLLERYLKENDILYVDALKTYREYLDAGRTANGLPEGFYSSGNDTRHPGVLACRLIAEALFRVFRENGTA